MEGDRFSALIEDSLWLYGRTTKNENATIEKLLPNGSSDPSYGNGGILNSEDGGALFLPPNHLLLNHGSSGSQSVTFSLILLSTGRLVPTFGENGKLIRTWDAFGGMGGTSLQAFFYPPEHILLGVVRPVSAVAVSLRLEKIDLRGQPDPTFGTNGVVELQTDSHLSWIFYPSFRKRL